MTKELFISTINSIKKHTVYKGNRIKRGLFKSSEGVLINADVNGSLNILKKVVGKFNYNPIEVCSTPSVITVKFNQMTLFDVKLSNY